MGLQPGNHGSWFQDVPADSIQLLNTKVTLDISAGGKTSQFANHDDMVVQTLQAKANVDLKNSPIVFMGFGADAPQWHWNDYKGRGRQGQDGDRAGQRSRLRDARSEAVRRSGDDLLRPLDVQVCRGRAKGCAAACFIVHTSDAAAGYSVSRIAKQQQRAAAEPAAQRRSCARLPIAGWLTRASAERLFAAAGQIFDQLEKDAAKPGFKPVTLQATASVSLKNKIGHIQSHNVVAMVRGSSKPDEAVIYTAHWDHLGTDPSLKGHKVYGGAVDNGTGLTMLLELADAFAHQKTPPQRSVLFFMPTLEESGLLGSQYYASKPIFALDKTVADIAVDALPIIGRAHDMTVIGKGQSQLEDMLADVLKTQGRVISPETTPENGFYFRSDHFNFAKVGVPAMLASSGLDLLNGGREAGQKAASDYTAHHYHTPNDVFDPNWDYSGILEDTQALYLLGQKLSEDNVWPTWYADSPFKAKRHDASTSDSDGK